MQKIVSLFVIGLLCLGAVFSQNTDPNCQPNGIKLSLGDNFDLSTQYDAAKLLAATRHDYTITYFTKANCPDNYCTIYSSYNKSIQFTLKPIAIKQFNQAKDTTGFANTQTRTQDFSVYVSEYQLDASNLKFAPDSVISYTCFYKPDAPLTDVQSKGPYEFYHPDYSQLKSREFKFAWIADFDINANPKNQRAYGKDNMGFMDKYIKQDRKNYVAIIGGGDYAYDLMDDSGQRGLNFLKAAEFTYSTIPFVTIAGNHEEWYNYSYYKSFFRNPKSQISESDYYTMSFGDLLLVGMNTNKYIKDPKTNKNVGIDQQYLDMLLQWFDKTMTEMKGKYRWSVVYSHQNLYCFENYASSACYTNPVIFAGLEELLNKHKVDIYLAGHVHAYERVHPNYKGQARFTENDQCRNQNCTLYTSPSAPVYVVDGTGGSDHYFPKDVAYPGGQLTVTSDNTLGFSTISVKNSTHLVFEHILPDNNFQVFDTFTIYKPLVNVTTVIESAQQPSDDSSEHTKMYIIFFVILGFVVAVNVVLFIWFKNKLMKHQSHQKVSIRQSDTENGVITQNQF